jgi:hypothetical protein
MDSGPNLPLWRRLALPLACLLLLAGSAWLQRPDGKLHIYILETSGDAVLIQTPTGRFVLVDGGSDPSRLTMLMGQLMPFWRRDLRAAVLTGTSGDRIGGQVAALAHYRAELILAPPGLGRHGLAGEWRRLAAQTPTRTLSPGQRIELDGATLSVLAAEAGDQGGAVLLLSYGATRVLLHSGGPAGDEAAQHAAGRPLDLLVYPWQRNPATATVAALRPRVMVLTDSYEAPTPALLSFAERRRYSPQVFHPKADGQIELISDGQRSVLVMKEEG